MKPPGWWDRVVVPKLICTCCGQEEIMDARRKIVQQANGDVLELGCGGGLNIPLVSPNTSKAITGSIRPRACSMHHAPLLKQKGWPPIFKPGLARRCHIQTPVSTQCW
jgi:hypothetical protein